MARRPLAVNAVIVVLAVLSPVLFVGNGLYLLTHGWFVRAEYARPGFPDDEFGMSRSERIRLADVGLASILPWHRDGIERLQRAQLSDHTLAFDGRELRHMRDVRRLLSILLALHAVALVSFVVLAAVRRTRDVAARALRAGALVTLGLFVFVGAVMLANDDWFLTGFHSVFFSGRSWRFADEETLRRLFPDLFWRDVTTILAGLALLQSLAALWLTWWRPRRVAAKEAVAAPAN
jgi:integral membrane protein (TIGR01906 family)